MTTVHAEIDPLSVDLDANIREAVDQDVQTLNDRFGTLVREGVMKLPPNTDCTPYELRGMLEFLVPTEQAAEVTGRLTTLRSLNGKQIWNVSSASLENKIADPRTTGSGIMRPPIARERSTDDSRLRTGKWAA